MRQSGESVSVDVESQVVDVEKSVVLVKVKELHDPKRLEPTRYGDWEKNGRCIDF